NNRLEKLASAQDFYSERSFHPLLFVKHGNLCGTRPCGFRSGRDRRGDPSALRSAERNWSTVRAMSTEPQRTCPSCGNEFSGAMEFCPVCMLHKGLAGWVESGESSVSGDTLKSIPNQPVQRFDHYELVTGEDGKPVELGRGAMGVTYKALDINLRCPVTLKV